MKPLSATELRANIYQVLDQVLATGVAATVIRHGKTIRLVPESPPSKLDALEPHPQFLTVPAEDLIHLDWSGEWQS